MNRLCQSSYGNLEAVINFAGCNGNPDRRLVHFYRDRITGKWSKADIISTNPHSGGSIIQNSTRRLHDQIHGDFEVLVLGGDGIMKHYTRDNTIPVSSGLYAWRLSATVNSEQHLHHGKLIACDASPLYQSKTSNDDSSEGTTLETAVLTNLGDIFHYRCSQSKHDGSTIIHQWNLVDRITYGATGPACLYQDSQDDLKALVPLDDGIVEYSFMFGAWNRRKCIAGMSGPACIYNPNPADLSKVYAVVRCNNELTMLSNDGMDKLSLQNIWQTTDECQPPFPLRRLFGSSHHGENSRNPMAVISQSLDTLGHSPNVEAIVFHPCGTGWQGRWMVLHWSFLTLTKQWMVSEVVIDDVNGPPM
ncbi:hypothetical protein F4804DRAFT_348628 [Jackrogersella minutella]|nr:hypothetical protein F4804DRAFT_348628 [Jackrogersella minutella]